MSLPDAALIWCPFPDEASAVAAADSLLGEGLVACANILPPMRSLYVWRGQRGEGRETGVLFKTNAQLLEAAIKRLGALHPYEEPAILGWRCDAGAPATLAWLGAPGEGGQKAQEN
ncbi:MAG TPA: divalent-cation tolerance protein CutA [Novosphingobium sp.]|nr:divalent-cation tolerance protein CutA [Novosphingobium sp.]